MIFNQAPSAGAFTIFQGNVTVLGSTLAEWYGAKGDGVTDDATAIQTALSSSRRVNLLAKSYFIGSNTIKPNLPPTYELSLVGAGVDLTYILVNQTSITNQDVIYFQGLDIVPPPLTAEAVVYWEIGGFTLKNNSYSGLTASTLPTGGDAIRVNFSSNGYLHDVKILNCWGGVWFTTLGDCVVRANSHGRVF
jgi:hypothetical protein